MAVHYKKTRYGFELGAAEVSCVSADDKKGWVLIGIRTPKTQVQVYVTKTGKLRVFTPGGKEWKPQEVQL